MSRVFSNAAIERIARVVQAPSKEIVLSAADFVDQALKDDLPQRSAGLLPEGLWIFSLDDDPAFRFASFVELIELGIRSGYVSLEGWEGAPALKDALSTVLSGEREADFGSPDAAAFESFESYLHLTSRLRADEAVLSFLRETHTSGNLRGEVDKDRAALLSPRHFAEAFATGAIAGVKVSNVAAGVALLRYFEWLNEIMEPLDPESDICVGIFRHARWSHAAARVRGRFDLWADLMSDWTERPAEAKSNWSETAERLFGLLANEQEPWEVAVHPEGEPEAVDKSELMSAIVRIDRLFAEGYFDRLIAEGRLAAARDLALAEAMHLQRYPIQAYGEFMRICQLLVKLGGPDAAAALLAPVIPALLASHGELAVSGAREILARARQGGSSGGEEVPTPEPSGERAGPPAAPAEEPLRRPVPPRAESV